jgi:hypothetical protein
MKVIGAGMPRTGTLTQKVALETLGLGPCYHMVNVLADLEQAKLWDRALNGDECWPEIFNGSQATELADYYPEAKVVLSVRDPEAWEKSMRQTVWAVRNGESLLRLLSSAQAHVNPQWRAFLGMIDQLLWKNQGTFSAGHAEPQQMIDTMERHNASVIESIPAERLLVWNVAEGWNPLCDFLELPVPSTPLPHVNDRTEFLSRIIDGSLESLQKWHEQEGSVDPDFAVQE